MWLQIAKAEFFVLTARFKGRRKLFVGLLLTLGIVWAAWVAPILVKLVLDVLVPVTPIHLILQVMLPGLMRAVMLLLWMLVLIIPLGQALAEIKIGQWEILLASNAKTRDILAGTFLGKIPTYTLYILLLAPILLAPFVSAFQVSLLGLMLIYTTLILMVLTTLWVSNVICAAIQAKLGDSPRGNDIAKAIAMLLGLITVIPVLGLQLFAPQLSAILGMNIFLVLPSTWSADLVSWLVITFNGINLTASQIASFQSILELDLFTNGLLTTLFGVTCVGVGLLSTDRIFTYRIGMRTETTSTVKRKRSLLRHLGRIRPSSFGVLVVTSLKTFYRKAQNLSKIAMALTMALMLPFLVILVFGQRVPITLDSLLPTTGSGLAYAGIIAFSGTSFLEGRDQLWIIQTAPHGASRFVRARLLVALFLALPLSLVPTTTIAILMSVGFFGFLGLFAYGYLMVCSAALLGTGITAFSPNYEDMKSPVHTRNMMIAMMICLFVTMAGPLLLSFITRITMGVSFDTFLANLGLASEVGRAIIATASLLVLGGVVMMVGARRLGRVDK
jgi:hypothetical protein